MREYLLHTHVTCQRFMNNVRTLCVLSFQAIFHPTRFSVISKQQTKTPTVMLSYSMLSHTVIKFKTYVNKTMPFFFLHILLPLTKLMGGNLFKHHIRIVSLSQSNFARKAKNTFQITYELMPLNSTDFLPLFGLFTDVVNF